MATGYTSAVGDGKITNFETFVMRCSRAMMPLITMRDDPADAEIPEKFEVDSYYRERAEEARERLSRLRHLTPDEAAQQGMKEREDRIQADIDSADERREENRRFEKMKAAVEQWVPPTEDHVGLKDFMIQQLAVSMNGEYPVRAHTLIDPHEWWNDAIKDAANDLQRAENKHAEEVERTKWRNDWLAALRKSLESIEP